VDDEEFVRWYGPWSPLDVGGVARLLVGFDAPWWVVGGYAIERFTGVARSHEDIDIAVLRRDTGQLLRFLSADFQAWANCSGSLTPMLDGRIELPSDAGQIWIRRSAMAPWEVDFVIADERDGKWVWRHDPTVTMTLAELTWIDDAGVRFARPEVVLAHKAKWRQPKDDLDFDEVWPLLDDRAKAWLHARVAAMYSDHPWLSRMRLHNRIDLLNE
jgi:hypothetical protein